MKCLKLVSQDKEVDEGKLLVILHHCSFIVSLKGLFLLASGSLIHLPSSFRFYFVTDLIKVACVYAVITPSDMKVAVS